MRRVDGFAPIGAYGAIGDGRTVALVALDGSIDFLSLPNLHAPTTFAALLDPERGGRFALAPEGEFEAERRYVERTNVLETVFRTASGSVRVTDALTLEDGVLLPWVEVARRVEGLDGSVRMRWSIEPRFDWGRAEPRTRMRRGTPVAEGADVLVAIQAWDAGEPGVADGRVGSTFETAPGSRALLALVAVQFGPVPIPRREDVERRIDGTCAGWRRWLDHWDYDGPWAEAVARSALALRLLVHTPDGAIAAAPTTSLPERIGGDRNYDYRYAWVRDSAYTLDALIVLGLRPLVQEAFSWLLRAIGQTEPDLRPFYALDGTIPERLEELPLRGYRDSRPVRYGNAATSQLQLGSWGDLLETADLYVREGNEFDGETGRRLADTIDRLCVIWRDEDSGIWELPDLRHYTISKLSCWTAFDRALTLVEQGQLPGDHAARWREEREAVREFVETRCFSEARGSYTFYADSEELDASVLRAARMGFADPAGERMAGTIAAVREELSAGGPLLYRYSGQAAEEGAFLACSFWLVEALARAGRVDEARATMEELLPLANDLGLYSEEIDPETHELLGNFPQGLTHLALVTAAGAVGAAGESHSSRIDRSVQTDARRLRATFEEVPELYDRARPRYPPQLFDDLVAYADLEPGARVLEIGCGTGQATLPLAERGLEVVCVELGAGLAAVARRKLADFPRVEVEHAVFEEWEAEEASFDAVVAFTALHWVDPEAKYAKPARLLRPGGCLAVAETHHVQVEAGDPFWAEVQADYDGVVPSDENRPPPRPEEVGDLRVEIEETGLFGDVEVRRYLADVTYSAEEYVAVLDTYSPNRAMEPETRERLFDLIRRRVEAQPGGTVRKTYLFTLNLARRLDYSWSSTTVSGSETQGWRREP